MTKEELNKLLLIKIEEAIKDSKTWKNKPSTQEQIAWTNYYYGISQGLALAKSFIDDN